MGAKRCMEIGDLEIGPAAEHVHEAVVIACRVRAAAGRPPAAHARKP